ncbi:MAG: hypothetical protein WBA57_23600 [Elainellaceae cyanobacterium]
MTSIVRAYPIHRQTLGFERSQGVCKVIGCLLLQFWSNEHRDRSLNQPRRRQPTLVGQHYGLGWSQQQAAVYQSKR